MALTFEQKIEKIPLIRNIYHLLNRIKIKGMEGVSLYELLKLYLIGIVEGALSYHSSSVAFNFFMALFPFMLFTLNLIPYIPIEGFQDDFLLFVKKGVPPTTFDAIKSIIEDILHNSHTGLLSWGFVLSVFLMANGVSGLFGGFESSKYVILKRSFFNQYIVSIGISIILSILLLSTIASCVFFEVLIQKTSIQDKIFGFINLLELGRFIFVIIMILIASCLLLKFGTKPSKKAKFLSPGAIFTTILIIISSYSFGFWVLNFSKYNEFYGSIGALLIVMFFVWIICMILLLGFELNSIIMTHKTKNINE